MKSLAFLLLVLSATSFANAGTTQNYNFHEVVAQAIFVSYEGSFNCTEVWTSVTVGTTNLRFNGSNGKTQMVHIESAIYDECNSRNIRDASADVVVSPEQFQIFGLQSAHLKLNTSLKDSVSRKSLPFAMDLTWSALPNSRSHSTDHYHYNSFYLRFNETANGMIQPAKISGFITLNGTNYLQQADFENADASITKGKLRFVEDRR
jgi:hypothetical protein